MAASRPSINMIHVSRYRGPCREKCKQTQLTISPAGLVLTFPLLDLISLPLTGTLDVFILHYLSFIFDSRQLIRHD